MLRYTSQELFMKYYTVFMLDPQCVQLPKTLVLYTHKEQLFFNDLPQTALRFEV